MVSNSMNCVELLDKTASAKAKASFLGCAASVARFPICPIIQVVKTALSMFLDTQQF